MSRVRRVFQKMCQSSLCPRTLGQQQEYFEITKTIFWWFHHHSCSSCFRVAGAFPSRLRGEAGHTPDTRLTQTTIHAYVQFRVSNKTKPPFLEIWIKPEYPERTNTGMQTEKPWPHGGIEPRTLFLWGNSANQHATVLPLNRQNKSFDDFMIDVTKTFKRVIKS